MPYAGPGPLWPWSDAGEGAGNARLQGSLPGTNTVNGGVRFTGSTTTYILHKPGVANNTTPSQTAQPSTIAGQGFGYNVLKTDMNADTALPAKRRIPAGNWTFKVVLNTTAVDLDAVFGFHVNVYKRSATGTLTHQAGGQSNLASIAAGDNDRTATVAVPEIILETDETIHVEYWIRGNGPAVGNNDISFAIGDPGLGDATNILLPGTGLGYRRLRSHAVAGTGAATLFRRKTKRRVIAAAAGLAVLGRRKTRKFFTVAATGGVAFARKLRVKRSFSVAGAGAAVLGRRKTRKFFTVAATGGAAFARRLTLRRSFSVAASGGVAIKKKSRRAFSVAASGAVAFARRLTLRRSFSVAGSGSAAFARAVRARRSFVAAATGGAAFSRVVRARRTLTAAATGGAAFSRRVTIKRAFSVAGEGGVSFARKLRMRRAFSVAGNPSVAFTRTLRAFRSFSVPGTPGASFSRVVRSRRSFSVAGVPGVRLWLKIREDALDRITGGGGGPTIIKKIIAIFDD